MEPSFPEDAVEVGRILGAWGVKGWIKVLPYADDPQALFSSKRWFLKPPEAPGPVPPGGWPAVLRVSQSREQGDAVVAAIQEMDDRNAAEALRGARIFIARSSFPTAADDEYYWVDLIGLAVSNRQDEQLGTVVGLLDTGAHSVLRVQAESAPGQTEVPAERLIPFVGAYVDSVDMAARRIVVDWGLDY